MKPKLLLALLALSFNANADCFSDSDGNHYCVPSPPAADFRTDHNSPQLYENGEYRGNLNGNKFDPNSISNEYGRYGNEYSPDSIKNPYRERQR
jgi:hypothetical protein